MKASVVFITVLMLWSQASCQLSRSNTDPQHEVYPATASDSMSTVNHSEQLDHDRQPEVEEVETVYLEKSEIKKVAYGLNGFSLDVVRKLRNRLRPNYVISPLGVAINLSMTLNGASGETKDEIIKILGLTQDDNTVSLLNSFCNLISSNLNNPTDSGLSSLYTSYWIRDKFRIKDSFIETCRKQYHTSIYVRDLSTEATMREINDLVSQNTNGLINNFLSSPLNPATNAALLNTIYLKGKWDTPFKKGQTKKEVFHNYDGSEGKCDMMIQRNEGYQLKEFDNFRLIHFPMESDRYGVDILLPCKGKTVAESLTELTSEKYTKWRNWCDRIGWDIIKIPKWEIETETLFKPTLQRLGLRSLFDSEADLSGITDQEPFFIGDIMQKAKFIVNEEGAEAAAATMDMAVGSTFDGPKKTEPTELIIDRPFMYILTDTRTNTILFVGEIRKFDP